MERFEEILDEMNITCDIKPNEALVEFWTDKGDQDIFVSFDYDGTPENFVEKFTECAENYDVYDEVEIYADNRGKKGVPKTIRDLVEGCQEAKDTLMEIAKKFKAALDSEETEDYTVTYKIEAIYRVTVQAKDLDDAIDKADSELESADFGEAIDVEGYLNRVRDESGEIVCDND